MSDFLLADELRPVGGSWTGLLFENPTTDYPLALTWTFTVDFSEVRRDFGSTPTNLAIDWVPLPESNWRSMKGRQTTCETFAHPIETSVYYFDHHRYDSVELTITDQRSSLIDIRVAASGDIDGLGLATISTAATLSFGGIYVQTDDVGTNVETAEKLLSGFTDTAGLRGRSRGHNVFFETS